MKDRIKHLLAIISGLVELPNQYAGAHSHENGRITLESDVAITLEFAAVKAGSTAARVAVTAASTDVPLGIAESKTDGEGYNVAVRLYGKGADTKPAVAGDAITRLARVIATADGKHIALPTDAGTYYVVGRALTAAAADGDLFELDDCHPVPVVVSE
jgi:hypothetical protein